MATKLDDLLTAVLRLPRESRQRLLEVLETAQVAEANAVHDGEATYQSGAMTHVTVVLPDDLAEQAKDAGLLAGKSLETLIRRALQEQTPAAPAVIAPDQKRRLVRENGYLVVEALPGEKPITTEEVRQILDDMEW